MSSQPLPIAAYRRVSSVGSRTGDRFRSPEDQRAEIERWAESHGHTVEWLDPELDAKGDDATRPILRRAVDGVKAGEFAGVVVAYLSRAGRDLRLMLDLWDEVEQAGGSVYFARENIDASTRSGRLHRNMLAVMAQSELEERREGFDAARSSAVERGIWRQRQTPRGYSRDADTRGLVPDDRADEVRRAFADRGTGVATVAIADRLGMTPGGVRSMLRNRVYLGELRDGGHVNERAHEALVDLPTFEAAQRTFARRPRVEREPSLLAGLVRCGSCGHVMTRGTGGKGHKVYGCPRDHSGGRCPGPTAITCKALDEHVDRIARVELARLSVQASDGKGVERANTRVTSARAELAAYVDAVSVADIGADAFQTGARSRRAAIAEAEADLRAEIGRSTVPPEIADGAAAWDELGGQERNALLRALLSVVIVRRAGGRGVRVPLEDRVRVLAFGAEIDLPRRNGGAASGIVPLELPDLDDERVLRVAGSEDALEGAGGAGKVLAAA